MDNSDNTNNNLRYLNNDGILINIKKNLIKFIALLFSILCIVTFFNNFLIMTNNKKVDRVKEYFSIANSIFAKGGNLIYNYFDSLENFFYKEQKLNDLRRRILLTKLESESYIESDPELETLNYNEENNIYSINEELDEKIDMIQNSNITFNITDYKYYLSYELLNNITSTVYTGNWFNMKLPKDTPTFFENQKGQTHMYIMKNNSNDLNYEFPLVANIESVDSIDIALFIKDGKYKDNFMIINFSLILEPNFSSKLSEDREYVKVYNKNRTIDIRGVELFDDIFEIKVNETDITLELIRSPKLSMSFDEMQLVEYSKANLIIKDHNNKFSIEAKFEVEPIEHIETRIWNYSLILTFISIAQIYQTYQLAIQVGENHYVGKNICLITLGGNIIWNSFICTIHFYQSMTDENNSYEYATPSMTYFLLFSIFELRLLFIVWKSRYQNIAFTDLLLFRKKMLRFYCCFCKIKLLNYYRYYFIHQLTFF